MEALGAVLRPLIALAAAAVFSVCSAIAAASVEAISLAGEPLTRPALADEFRVRQEALLAEAEAELTANPSGAEALIWKGRRLGYLGRYNDAIAVFREGAAKHPKDPRFLRHLGHRLITVRKIDEARETLLSAADLAAASPDEVEPDGLPNERGVPTSTLKGNIYYHLALAHYLNGAFEKAAAEFGAAAALADNADSAAASRYWLFLARVRAGDAEGARDAIAPVASSWEVIENGTYHRLALCFKGETSCDMILAEAQEATGVASPTLLYGLAVKRLIDGDRTAAHALMKEIVSKPDWASFGYIAAEADLASKRIKG